MARSARTGASTSSSPVGLGSNIPPHRRSLPCGPARRGVLLGDILQDPVLCTCPQTNQRYQQIHMATCPYIDLNHAGIALGAEKPPKRPALILPWQVKPLRPTASKKWNKARLPTAVPYRFVLQFYFTRPIDSALWKRIKAPKGWRKGPIRKDQDKWCGCRFICTDLKYALAPEEIEQLHSTLFMCLKEVF